MRVGRRESQDAHAMREWHRSKRVVTRHLWSLQKQGRHISFLLTDLDAGDFELNLTWFDETSRSIHTFRTRAAAMAEAERQLRMWVANGWEPRSDRR
jgi:hypothetical protein